MHERRRVNAEILDEASEPALLDPTPDDIENRRPRNSVSNTRAALSEQPEIGRTLLDDDPSHVRSTPV